MTQWKLKSPDRFKAQYLAAIRICGDRLLNGAGETELVIELSLPSKATVHRERKKISLLKQCLRDYPLHELHYTVRFHWRLTTIYSEGGEFPARFRLSMEDREATLRDLEESLFAAR